VKPQIAGGCGVEFISSEHLWVLRGHSEGIRERGIPVPDIPCDVFHPTKFL
jgi:hypothetical protein